MEVSMYPLRPEKYGHKSVEVSAALVTNVGQAASGIVSSILLAATGAALDSLKPQLKGYLGQKIGIASVLSGGRLGDVPTVIENDLDADYKFMVDAMKAGLGQGVGGLHSSLYGLLAGTDALLGGYEGIIQQVGINPFISRWVNDFVTPNIPDAETSWYMAKLGLLTDDAFVEYAHQNGWDDSWIEKFRNVWLNPATIGILLDARRRAKINDATLADQLRRYRLSDEVINAITNLVIQYPEPYRLAEMHSKGVISTDELVGVGLTFGLSPEWSLYWSEDQRRYPDFTTALALLRRGDISEETFYYWMQRGQVSPEDSEVMVKLKDVVPPISDLIRFAVREAYLDHDPEKQYSEMVRLGAKMGLSAEASEWYWYSHWERIPVNLMYSNYHRGLWDVKKLERMLKIIDVHPDDRQDIINVAYGVPSIRELGYGFDVGVYSLDDIKRFRRWGGLSPADAEKAGEAMVAYRTEAERNAVRTEYVYAYGRGKLTLEELTTKLTEIKTPEQAIPLWVERAEWYKDRIMKPQMDVEGRTVSSSEALTAFKLGLRNEDWTRKALANLDWTEERINVAIERAKLEMVRKEAEEAEVKYRKLTLAQLRQMYKVKLITKEQMTTEIVIMGYSPEDAELLTEIYTREVVEEVKPRPFTSAVAASMYKLAMFDEDDLYYNFTLQDWTDEQAAMLTVYTVLSQEYPLLRGLYEKGALTTQEFVAELVKLEVPEFEATELVKKTYREISIERLSVERDLTKAEILKGVKTAVLTARQGVDLLIDLGYDEDEAWYILAINKVVAAGDPDGYWEMKRVTESYKKARGEKAVEVPDELIMLERQLKQAQAKLSELKKTPEKEVEIAEAALNVNTVEQRMREIILKLGLK